METVKKRKLSISRDKFIVLIMMGIAQGAIFMLPYLSGSFYDGMRTALNATDEQLGMLMTIYGTITIFAALPGGWIADRFGSKKLVVLGLLITAVIGLIAAFVFNIYVYYVLWAALALVGNMLYWSAGMKVVRLVASSDEQGKAYGWFRLIPSPIRWRVIWRLLWPLAPLPPRLCRVCAPPSFFWLF